MEKNWNAMEELWKSYGISFLGICTNPVYRPTLTSLEVIDEINNDLDSDEKDLYEGNESYDDEEGGDIFTNLMRAAIDQSLDLDLVSELSSSPSDLEDDRL